MVWILKRSESAEKTLDFLFSAFFGSLGQAQTRTCVSVIYLSKWFILRHRDVLRIIFYFSIKSSFYIDSAFFFLLSRKKEETRSQKEERKVVVARNGSLSKDENNARAIISTKMLAHASHFRDVWV